MNIKHILLLAGVLSMPASTMRADDSDNRADFDQVSIDAFSIDVGRKHSAEIKLMQAAAFNGTDNGTDERYLSLQFDLVMPQGLVLEQHSDGSYVYERGVLLNENHEVSICDVNGNGTKYRVIIYATKPESYFRLTDNDVESPLLTLHFETKYIAGISNLTDNSTTISIENQVLTEAPSTKWKRSASKANVHIFGVDIAFDEMSTRGMSARYTVEKLLFLRTMKGNEWSTLMLPIIVSGKQLKEAFGDDVQVAEFTGSSFSYTEDSEMEMNLQFTTRDVTDDFLMNRHTPFLIRTTHDISQFRFDVSKGTEVALLVNKNLNVTQGDFTFYGTYVYIDNETNKYLPDYDCIFFLSGDKLYYTANKVKMKGFRGYFSSESAAFQDWIFAEASSPTTSRMTFTIDGDAADIPELQAEAVVPEGAVYDLQGRKMDATNLRPGLYIVNGRKRYVK